MCFGFEQSVMIGLCFSFDLVMFCFLMMSFKNLGLGFEILDAFRNCGFESFLLLFCLELLPVLPPSS